MSQYEPESWEVVEDSPFLGLDELESAQKTEIQKYTDRIEKLKRDYLISDLDPETQRLVEQRQQKHVQKRQELAERYEHLPQTTSRYKKQKPKVPPAQKNTTKRPRLHFK